MPAGIVPYIFAIPVIAVHIGRILCVVHPHFGGTTCIGVQVFANFFRTVSPFFIKSPLPFFKFIFYSGCFIRKCAVGFSSNQLGFMEKRVESHCHCPARALHPDHVHNILLHILPASFLIIGSQPVPGIRFRLHPGIEHYHGRITAAWIGGTSKREIIIHLRVIHPWRQPQFITEIIRGPGSFHAFCGSFIVTTFKRVAVMTGRCRTVTPGFIDITEGGIGFHMKRFNAGGGG